MKTLQHFGGYGKIMTIEEKKYYEVECKCGHTGSRKFYIPIKFAVKASNGKEAAEIGRQLPRCKHDHKDCVLGIREITHEEFVRISLVNRLDPFLNCHSIQEQKQFDLSDRMVEDPHYRETHPEEVEKEVSIKPVFKGKTRIKNPKKFIRFYQEYSMEVCY